MEEKKTIIVIGVAKASELSAEITELLKKEYGDDLVILSREEANEKGILNGTVPSISEFKIVAPPMFKMAEPYYDKNQLKNDCKKGWRK